MEHPSSIAAGDGCQQASPPHDEASERKKRASRKQPRKQQRGKGTHEEERLEESTTASKPRPPVTLQVRNISVGEETFRQLLGQVKVPAFRLFEWRKTPAGARCLLEFGSRASAGQAQKVIGNISVGDRKMVAEVIRRDEAGTAHPAASRPEEGEGESPGATGASVPATGYGTGGPSSRSPSGKQTQPRRGGRVPVRARFIRGRGAGPDRQVPGRSSGAEDQTARHPSDDPPEGLAATGEPWGRSLLGPGPGSAGLYVADIGCVVDKASFCSFLRALGIEPLAVDFLEADKSARRRCATVFFASGREAAEAKEKLMNARGLLYGSPMLRVYKLGGAGHHRGQPGGDAGEGEVEMWSDEEGGGEGQPSGPDEDRGKRERPSDAGRGRMHRGRGVRGRGSARGRPCNRRSSKATAKPLDKGEQPSQTPMLSEAGADDGGCPMQTGGRPRRVAKERGGKIRPGERRPSSVSTDRDAQGLEEGNRAETGSEQADRRAGGRPQQIARKRGGKTRPRERRPSTVCTGSDAQGLEEGDRAETGSEQADGQAGRQTASKRGASTGPGKTGSAKTDGEATIARPKRTNAAFPGVGGPREGTDEERLAEQRGGGQPMPALQQEVGYEESPNGVILTDLPKDITEKDVVDAVKGEDCRGFRDARLRRDLARKQPSSCSLAFSDRPHAVAAAAKLLSKPIRGHRIQARLAVDHEREVPAIARLLLAAFRDEEMPARAGRIRAAVRERLEEIQTELDDLQGAADEQMSFPARERLESTVADLQHRSAERRRYLDEFEAVCGEIEGDVQAASAAEDPVAADVLTVRQHFERECRRAESPLPVYGFRSAIQRAIGGSAAVVLQGETGSGKSTQIPQYVVDMARRRRHDDGGGEGRVWRVACTQPRRVAALTLAKRVAEEYGCRVGEEIGYHVGNRRSAGPGTVVTFMTDRKLLDACMADPELADYNCVIVDEAHERSVDTDLLLGTLKGLLSRRADDLHLLVMSATIDVKLFTDYLGGCESITVPGRTFPVEKHWHAVDSVIRDGNHVAKTVQLAAQLHRDEGAGDILVFLTSANEIDTACRDLATTLGQQADEALILPLHGRLQAEDQMKVFAEPEAGRRKIVFATNIAETSVTIKGIRFVVDPGLVKECQYDPRRGMSLLQVAPVTRASAEQRAGRAGRTGPGVCHRLYSREEYDGLEATGRPEILRVHLGMAALQLLELGVEDVAGFDFIQAPDGEASRQALASLRLLGAVENEGERCRLTPLGRKMAKLPLEPRLSKMVLEGAEKGLGREAVALAALLAAPGSIFYRGGSDKDKEKSDRLKLSFCHESGDALTMLNAFGQWHGQPAKEQAAWCMANSLNSKTLRAAQQTVQEVCQTLKREHGVDWDCRDKSWRPALEPSEPLQKLVLSSYVQSLSLYNSHPRAGYTVLGRQAAAHVHPSSALRALNLAPRWLVCQELKRTSRDFLLNVTPVEATWLAEVAPGYLQAETDLAALEEAAAQELPAVPLGNALLGRLSARRNEKLRALEERTTEAIGAPCVVEIDRDAKALRVFASPWLAALAAESLRACLAEQLRSAEREQLEVPVGESGAVRQVLAAGGRTRFVLAGGDYRALEIANPPPQQTPQPEVEAIVRSAAAVDGDILDVYAFPASRSAWGRVTFASPEVAAEAKRRMDAALARGEISLTARPLTGRHCRKTDVQQVSTRAVITWAAWPAKGIAFINCSSTEEACNLRDDLISNGQGTLRGSTVNCLLKRNDTRGLFIPGLSVDVTLEELEAYVRRRTDVPFIKCSITRTQPTIVIPEAATRDDIHRLFGGTDIKLDILRPKSDRTQIHKAIVTFPGDGAAGEEEEEEEAIARSATREIRNAAGQLYHVKLVASCRLFCKPAVYACLEGKIGRLAERVQARDPDSSVRVGQCRHSDDRMIDISGGDPRVVRALRQHVLGKIRGETVTVADLVREGTISQHKKAKLLEMLQNFLGDLLADLEAHAYVDRRRQVIVVFGKSSARENFKLRARYRAEHICSNLLREIPLAGSNKGRAVRALVKAYGPWLQKLQEESGADKVVLNIRSGMLLVEGEDDLFDKVHSMVESCLAAEDLQDSLRNDGREEERKAEEVECGICFTSVDGGAEVYRLCACSHGFHRDCLQEMFRIRLREASRDFPIECPSDGCGRALLLCDIRSLCPDEADSQTLHRLALEAHVAQESQGKLRFCPTPDCPLVYRPTEEVAVYTCPECRARICASCGEEPHSGGQSCEEFKRSQKSFDDIDKWIASTGADAKKCPTPNCGCVIQRNDGCNNMRCIKCNKSICWVCLEYFTTSSKCYDHLTAKHGGCF